MDPCWCEGKRPAPRTHARNSHKLCSIIMIRITIATRNGLIAARIGSTKARGSDALMPRSDAATSVPHLLATEMIRDPSEALGLDLVSSSHRRVATREGVQLMHWSTRLANPIELSVLDDSGLIHFSYVLLGESLAVLNGRKGHGVGRKIDERQVHAASGNIAFGPGQCWRFHQHGVYESVGVMLRHDAFEQLVGDAEPTLRRALSSGLCFETGHRGTELHATAQALAHAMRHRPRDSEASGERHPLWLQAQGLTLVSLLLEARADTGGTGALDRADQMRLASARAHLLSDLSQPPLILDVARENGLSPAKLKRGFRALYGFSVYGLFQHERMNEARRRLLRDDTSVSAVACDLGYSNMSHFSAAFRKQFGVNPGEARRRGR